MRGFSVGVEAGKRFYFKSKTGILNLRGQLTYAHQNGTTNTSVLV